MKRSVFATPYLIWMAIFILVPLGIIVYYAMTAAAPDGGVVFTLDNLIKAFDPLYMGILGRSVWLAFIATCVCLLIGYPVALILTSRNFKKGSLLIILFVLPMWMNFLLRTYALINILDSGGVVAQFLGLFGIQNPKLLYNTFAIILGLVYNYLPFMILPIYSAMVKIDHGLIEAAEDLGANSWDVFRRVRFPLSLPGVVSGITMVFMPAVTTFAVSRLLGGSNFMMYGDVIENQFFFMRDWHFGATLSLVMMVLMLVSSFIFRKYQDDDSGGMLW
ncbi:ABC transporter permease [Christensenella sp. MSJ-20]|uniref:ABC transporter permease n=1 Tax=Christensenella sp. MSJ-20 TaxID=2841518 RepID=UPI001C77150B|nr:ABC transporter permease [Christensenella sp. MSJ-20]